MKDAKNESQTVVVLDDLHLLKGGSGHRAVSALTGREDIWLILVCRSSIPSWLIPPYVRSGFLVITDGRVVFTFRNGVEVGTEI